MPRPGAWAGCTCGQVSPVCGPPGGVRLVDAQVGLTVDHLHAVELVTADGQQVRASAVEHPDLFWGVRGGGGNFGVVTTFEFELVEVGPMVLGGPILHDIEDAAEVLAFWESFMRTAPDELTSFAVFLTVPPSGPFPEHLWGRQVIVVDSCYAGDLDEGARSALRSRSPLDMFAHAPLSGQTSTTRCRTGSTTTRNRASSARSI